MSNENQFELSAELQQFILLAIEMGLDDLQKSGSLTPIVLGRQGDKYSVGVLAVGADVVMDAAAGYVAGLAAETSFYALVFKGKLEVEGTEIDAVIVQAGERGGAHGHLLYQPCDPHTHEAIGAPKYGRQAEQFLRQ